MSSLSRRAVSRVARVATRTGRAARLVLDAATRVVPRRCPGAVQEPLFPSAELQLVRGWAWLGRREVAAVHVTIDGVVVAAAELGPTRPDVATARPETRGARRCSWEVMVDFSQHSGRDVVIGAFALSHAGVAQQLTRVRARVSPVLSGRLEAPREGQRVAPGPRLVTGWALPPDGVPARVHVRVGGHDAGLARSLSAPRPDVARSRPGAPPAPLGGFEHSVTIRGEPGTRVAIEVDVEDLDGAVHALEPVHVVVAPAPDVEPDDEPAPEPVERAEGPGVRLAIFTHRLDLGGGQLYVQELLRHLLADPEIDCLVVSSHDGPLRDELTALGARVEVTDYPIETVAAYRERRAQLERMLHDHRADVVLVNTMGAGIGADAALRCALPVVWVVRESYRPGEFWAAAYGEDRVDPSVRAWIEHVLAQVDAVVFEAEATRRAYPMVSDERAITIPHGVQLDSIAARRTRRARADARRRVGLRDEVVVLSVGTVEPRKAQGSLALAFDDVAAERPDAVLAIVGDGGRPYALALRQMISRLRHAAQIRLVPVTPDPHDWFLAADAFVMASDVESLPRVLLEAMAYELPVAATAVWGVPALIEDGRSGILFEPRDLHSLIDALRRLLALSPEARAQLGARAAATVRMRHDPAVAERAMRALLHGLAGDPEARVHELVGA